ncbi:MULTISPECIES: VOC family protein [unclassified Microbacterium]|uniref:VOC family protein n=1 Tax=unclassified Microbacterium TaxID=2609290 RepID=UPI00214B838E|nr:MULTISPECIES: VOC family protein [unclassified Microbacterium]MCR2783193.1 VOC family protein [Microbacterium sp. zg.B96]MDL5352022.1 VOC family protein [Microbacterium sp. zg-YB36]WIM15928.1 VOC family protein [Microbacterium sp. zg-B96]
MLADAPTFSGFSVDDIDAALTFYRDTLGLDASLGDMGIIQLRLAGGARAIAYPKKDHEPATFTILNFVVDDVDAAVDDLQSRGVETKIYTNPHYGTDERGIARGNGGPAIAWFRDPAGNVLSVLEDPEPA